MEEISNKKLVEAALFMSPNAMSIVDLSKATGIASPGHIEKLVMELLEEYKAKDTVLEILKINDKYMFNVKAPYSEKVSGLGTGPDLTKGAMRMLAYINKNEGVMQSRLVKAFGSTTYEYIKELAEKEFIIAKKVGRSKRIDTTPKFKEYFNV